VDKPSLAELAWRAAYARALEHGELPPVRPPPRRRPPPARWAAAPGEQLRIFDPDLTERTTDEQ
jgi:hypothetical protein